MTLLETLMPFIWFSGIAFVAYVFFHKFSDVIKEKFRSTTKQHNINKKDEGNVETQINKLIEGAPAIKTQLDGEISKLKDEGVSEEKLKSLLGKKQMVDFVVDNKEIIDIIGKPILKKILGVVQRF